MKTKTISIIALLTIAFSFSTSVSQGQYLFGGYQNGSHGSGGDEILVGIKENSELPTEVVNIYPNPFRSFSNVELELAKPCITTIEVFDMNNSLVNTLVSAENLNQGKQLYYWEGTNNKGQKLTAGVYYFKIMLGDKIISRKIVLMK